AQIGRDEVQGVLVHGAFEPETVFALPGKGEEHAFVDSGVLFQAFLEETGNGALGAADRAVQEQDTAIGAVALGRRLESIHQVLKLSVEAIDGVSVLGGKLS